MSELPEKQVKRLRSLIQEAETNLAAAKELLISVIGDDGKVVNWALEMTGANGLFRRGWRKEDLPTGTVLQVEGWQARNATPTANIVSVTFEDGRTLFAGSSNPAARQQ